MKRVEADAEWTLMCPKECPGLDDCYGEEFEKLYTKLVQEYACVEAVKVKLFRYEQSKRGVKTIKARDVWKLMINAQIETGTPYVLYKVRKKMPLIEKWIEISNASLQDACNAKSNQQNLGTIKCSNLCTEIVEYSSPDEVAVCNLASIALPRFVKEGGEFDFQKLREVR